MKVKPMLLHNPRAVRTAYPDDLHEFLNHTQAQISRDCLRQWRGIAPNPTPIYDLTDAAQREAAESALKSASGEVVSTL